MQATEQIKDAARFRIAKHGEDRGTASLTPFEVHKLMVDYDNRDKWIPVTERLPEHSGHQDYTSEVVWVAYTSPSCGTMIYCGTGYADYDDDGVSWRVWDYLGRPDKYKEVKFWQPLPKAPQI